MAERLGSLFSALILEELGFQSAGRSSLLPLLKDTDCSGSTALRDAILVGVRMMLRLGEALRKLGSFENYNFVHVVLTDGADNKSKTSVKDLQKLFLTVLLQEIQQNLKKIGLMIPVKMLTTHFIGVEMDEDDADELKQITALGLENAHLHQSNASGLDKIFTKIIASIKEQKQVRMQAMSMGGMQALRIQQSVNPYLELQVKKYVVLFTLDRSGSMSGSRWKKVCSCVQNFMNILGDNDLVAGIEFNDEVTVITRSAKAKAIENERRQQEECTIF